MQLKLLSGFNISIFYCNRKKFYLQLKLYLDVYILLTCILEARYERFDLIRIISVYIVLILHHDTSNQLDTEKLRAD